MAKSLVIVESPAKSRTIGRYLGKDYPFENRGSRTALIARVTPERITGEGPWGAGK